MKLLIRIAMVAVAIAALSGAASAQTTSSLFDAGSRLSIAAHARHVWFEGTGSDIMPDENRREYEGGLSLSWNLGRYMDANFSAMQGFESQTTTLRAGLSLMLLKPRAQ